jgi:hypothetical protein
MNPTPELTIRPTKPSLLDNNRAVNPPAPSEVRAPPVRRHARPEDGARAVGAQEAPGAAWPVLGPAVLMYAVHPAIPDWRSMTLWPEYRHAPWTRHLILDRRFGPAT